MDIRADDFLPGEKVLLSKSANSIIVVKEHGLSRFFADDLFGVIGMKGKEAIGGKLYLTNYRILFKAHRLNRLSGKFSIALPTIQSLKDTSRLLAKRMEVGTGTQMFEFVVWGIPELIKAVQGARDGLAPAQVEELRTAAVENYGKFGKGLKVVEGIEAMNKGLLLGRKLSELAKLATGTGDPVELSSILNLLELLSDEASPGN